MNSSQQHLKQQQQMNPSQQHLKQIHPSQEYLQQHQQTQQNRTSQVNQQMNDVNSLPLTQHQMNRNYLSYISPPLQQQMQSGTHILLKEVSESITNEILKMNKSTTEKMTKLGLILKHNKNEWKDFTKNKNK